MGDGDFQNGFCHRLRAGNLITILICGSHFYRTALRAGGVADGVHLPHDTPQFIHLGIVQRGHLGTIFCARHFCGEYRKDIFPVDRQYPVVGGDLLPVVGVGGFDILNVCLVFSVEASHRLGHAGSCPSGLWTKEQAEAGADNQSNQAYQQDDHHSDPSTGSNGGNQSLHCRDGRFYGCGSHLNSGLDPSDRRFRCGSGGMGGCLCRLCGGLGCFLRYLSGSLCGLDVFGALLDPLQGPVGCLDRFRRLQW